MNILHSLIQSNLKEIDLLERLKTHFQLRLKLLPKVTTTFEENEQSIVKIQSRLKISKLDQIIQDKKTKLIMNFEIVIEGIKQGSK